MLEKVDACHFTSLIGAICNLQIADGSVLPALVDCVTSKPLARNPYASKTRRLPFSVCLTATHVTDFSGGLCSIDIERFGRLDGVYVARVAPLGRDQNLAYYEIIFN